jgi:predicted nucleic acid-binding protein
MSADTRRFTIDTNILVYSVDLRAGRRRDLARTIIDAAAEVDCWLTLQALSEFYAAATRKGLTGRAVAADLALAWFETFPCASASSEAVRQALADAAAGRASYWDALLVATAAEAGCAVLLSEDMADGARIGGVEIVNPFAGDAISERARALLEIAE